MHLRKIITTALLMITFFTLSGMERKGSKKILAQQEAEQKKLNYKLACAAGKNNINDMKKSIEDGAQINGTYDAYLKTPLHCATENNCFDAAQFILQNGGKINARTIDCKPALYFAIFTKNGFIDLIKLFIEKYSADMTVNNKTLLEVYTDRSPWDTTPINQEIVALLKKKN